MMGIQNVAAIFCIPLIPLLLGYKIWQPHSVSPKRSKGGYRIWQAYRIWRYTVTDRAEISTRDTLLYSFYMCQKSKPLVDIEPVYEDHRHSPK